MFDVSLRRRILLDLQSQCLNAIVRVIGTLMPCLHRFYQCDFKDTDSRSSQYVFLKRALRFFDFVSCQSAQSLEVFDTISLSISSTSG